MDKASSKKQPEMQMIVDVMLKVRSCTDESELFKYGRSSDPAIALEVAKSLYANSSILDMLTRHPSIVVRHAVAQNPKTAEETLKRLSGDKDMLVRDYAKRNLSLRAKSTFTIPK